MIKPSDANIEKREKKSRAMNQEDMRRFSELLKQARERKHLTQAEAAVLCDTSETHYKELEYGSSGPSAEMLLRIFRIMDIPAEALFRPNDLYALTVQNSEIHIETFNDPVFINLISVYSRLNSYQKTTLVETAKAMLGVPVVEET